MSKLNDCIRELALWGWAVDDRGSVIKPDGSVRATRVKKCKARPSYLIFNVKHLGIATPIPVHRFAAYIRFGEKTFTSVVRHLEKGQLDNSIGNIVLGTVLDNIMDRAPIERYNHAMLVFLEAVKVNRALTEVEVGAVLQSSCAHKKLADMYKVSKSTIKRIRKNKGYKQIGVII